MLPMVINIEIQCIEILTKPVQKQKLKGEALVVNTFWWTTEQIIQPWGSIRSSDPIWPRGVRRGVRWSPDEG